MSVIDEVKTRIDIVDLVSETVQLRRSGKNYTGFCPFHSNSRTPAFAVFSDTGTWRCFGQCNEGGDIFRYVMKKEGWDFGEALRYLAEKAGVPLAPPTPQEQAAEEEHEGLRLLLEEAVTFYRHQLTGSTDGRPALDYLRQRGLNDQTMEAFGIGYSPNSWEAAHNHFLSKGFTEKDLNAVGLISERETGGSYDRFRNRIMFPIRDERGRMAGFGARILNPNDIPKFLNSPQTVLFDKGRLLYGLDQARKAIRTQDQAVLVEGYLDVIALHQAGFATAVSPMGTALTEHQLNLLKRFTHRITLALDPDVAGIQATLRGLELARKTLDHTREPVLDARGLLRHEARLQADIRVTTLPEGMDPDDVVKRDPKEWEKILAEAKPIVIHVMETLAASKDLDDPKVKDEIITQVLPLIADIPSSIERDTYRQRLARLLKVGERLLAGDVQTRPGKRRSATPPRTEAATRQTAQTQQMSNAALEGYILGVLLRQPDLLFQMDRRLQEAKLSRLSFQDFQHADHQTLLRLLLESIDQESVEPAYFCLNNLTLPMMELADGMLKQSEQLDPLQERVLEDVMRAVLELRRNTVRQSMEYMRFLMQDAHETGDLRASQYQQTMVQHIKMVHNLDQALGKYTNHTLPTRAPG